MLTLGQVKTSSVASIAGVNVSDPQFTLYVNDAVRQLMDLGNGGSRGWWGTVQAIKGTAYDGCFVWPSNVITVLGIATQKGVIPIKNTWYDFTSLGDEHNEWARCWKDRPAITFSGETYIFKSIAESPTSLMAICDTSADYNKTITIYGIDNNGKEVFTQRSDNSIQRGAVCTLGTTISRVTSVQFSYVTGVQKDQTVGPVRLYAYAANTGIGDLLAIYNGGETNPRFLYSKLANPCISMPVSALVKIGFSAVSQDSDIIPLDNVDAIKSMVQSIRSREAGDVEVANAQEKDAMRRLVAQVNSRFPLEQMVVRFQPFGSDDLSRQTVGMI
jgi:hypothetical protein